MNSMSNVRGRMGSMRLPMSLKGVFSPRRRHEEGNKGNEDERLNTNS